MGTGAALSKASKRSTATIRTIASLLTTHNSGLARSAPASAPSQLKCAGGGCNAKWLRSGGAGIAILDWNWTRDLLLDRELVAENIELGDRLAAALAPTILVVEAA